MDEKRFLSYAEMSQKLGIPESTLKAMVKKGVLPQPVEITSGKNRMFTFRDVDGIAYMLEVIGANRVRKSTLDEEDKDFGDES